jgi:hypothetical protein
MVAQQGTGLYILSTVDKVETTSIILNKGNCGIRKSLTWDSISNSMREGVDLKYGQSEVFPTDCTTILSADIKTDHGEWSYSF